MRYTLTLFSAFLLIGCGGGGGSSEPPQESAPALVTGSFVDSAVKGLDYTCSSAKSGTTDSDGRYSCEQGDRVTFYLGDTQVGAAVIAQTGAITPYTIFPTDLTSAINLARLLQTLDSDKDPSNGIDIDLTSAIMLMGTIDYASDAFTTDIEEMLLTSLVDAGTAQEHLNQSIIDMGDVIPDIGMTPVLGSEDEEEIDTPAVDEDAETGLDTGSDEGGESDDEESTDEQTDTGEDTETEEGSGTDEEQGSSQIGEEITTDEISSDDSPLSLSTLTPPTPTF